MALIKKKILCEINMTVYLLQAAAGKSCAILYDGRSNLGVQAVQSHWSQRTIQSTVTWWYILVVAESNGLNLCLGVNSHTQRSPPHTRSHVHRRETDSASGLPEDNFKVGFEMSLRAD